jgi:hypothetical protein
MERIKCRSASLFASIILGNNFTGAFNQSDQQVKRTSAEVNRYVTFKQELPCWP